MFTLAVVVNPVAVVAVVAVPVRFPTKLEAVMMPVVFTLAVVVNPEAVVADETLPEILIL